MVIVGLILILGIRHYDLVCRAVFETASFSKISDFVGVFSPVSGGLLALCGGWVVRFGAG